MLRQTLMFLRNSTAVAGLALLAGSGGLALRSWAAWNDAPPASAIEEAVQSVAEEFSATYDDVFHATVYYTPIEDAFIAADGYDMTPSTRSGLGGKKFARDFLKAVELEGFGRMSSAMEGKWYISCCRGTWQFAEVPLDSGGKPLQALRSTAVGAEHEWIGTQTAFRVRAAGLPPEFQKARWEVSDTGSGLKPKQIDFYWGEDAPYGPGLRLSRPKGMPNPVANPTILVLR